MNRNIQKKLRAQAGEAIAEVLLALLVCVIGVVMMVGMINASASLVNKSTVAMQKQYKLTRSSASGSAGIHLYWVPDGQTERKDQAQIAVTPYQDGDTPVFYAPYVPAS